MFTGIIESLGNITNVETDQSNRIFTIASPISHELKIDQSIAHNGVCLTVTQITDGQHTVCAIEETLISKRTEYLDEIRQKGPSFVEDFIREEMVKRSVK